MFCLGQSTTGAVALEQRQLGAATPRAFPFVFEQRSTTNCPMRVASRVVNLALASGAFGSLALPQSAAAAETPGFATLDRADSGSRLEAAFGLSFFDNDTAWVGRADLYGQFSSTSGWGGYAAVPYSFVLDESNYTGLGNLELGGLYTTSGNLPFVLHAGVVFATGSKGYEAGLANSAASAARFTDVATATRGPMWLRLAASPLWRSGSLFFRFDAGFDIPFGQEEYQTTDALMHLNLGIGYVFGKLATSLELVNLGTTGDSGATDRFTQLLSLGLRQATGDVRPFASLAVPVDESLGNFNAVLILGVQLHLDR